MAELSHGAQPTHRPIPEFPGSLMRWGPPEFQRDGLPGLKGMSAIPAAGVMAAITVG